MSFFIEFSANGVYSARAKLRECYAPEAVKAVIELALAGIPPTPPALSPDEQTATALEYKALGVSWDQVNRTPAPPALLGIFVKASGHIDEHGGRSFIDNLVVQPLYE